MVLPLPLERESDYMSNLEDKKHGESIVWNGSAVLLSCNEGVKSLIEILLRAFPVLCQRTITASNPNGGGTQIIGGTKWHEGFEHNYLYTTTIRNQEVVVTSRMANVRYK